jgi:raffinose/stachyose/melibiose transport system substrate-binding protein
MRPIRIGQAHTPHRGARGAPDLRTRLVVAVLAGAVFALGVGAGEARPARSGQVTIRLAAGPGGGETAFDVLIPNFERVYPDIKVDATYVPTVAVLQQLETTELASGNGPDVLTTYPGCGNSVSVCALGPAGYLAPMIKAPWTKRSLPLVLSLDKYGQALVVFTPQVAPEGVFTNDGLFAKLGLKVPKTFPQLLDLCGKAKADGTVALIWPGGDVTSFSLLVQDLAVATVYGNDRHWTTEQKAGTVTFDGSAGWHQALQEVSDMNRAGCFEPGVSAASIQASQAAFAQGQGLMYVGLSSNKGAIDGASPQFSSSFYAFPGGTTPTQVRTFVQPNASLSVNARSSAVNQAAAQTFIDFIARPKQDALFAELTGGLTQYEFLKKQLPAFMTPMATVFTDNEYVMAPNRFWWNPNVQLALQTYGIGVITGQSSIDDVLNAMDAAWKQGPS